MLLTDAVLRPSAVYTALNGDITVDLYQPRQEPVLVTEGHEEVTEKPRNGVAHVDSTAIVTSWSIEIVLKDVKSKSITLEMCHVSVTVRKLKCRIKFSTATVGNS